ncbi:hypothetical protein FACS189449_11000 [Alphaproteobacteria bacterium]|nr:hypothetical protein FACS189449_11000 [Alphaproteobacteria bacterium]GHU18806.1 hypothetical protein FACS189472_07660 [Alphaproteobacteria bacterium]
MTIHVPKNILYMATGTNVYLFLFKRYVIAWSDAKATKNEETAPIVQSLKS